METGAHFLAAGGTPTFGILTGSGLHGELQLLHRIGLSAPVALVAATSKYSKAFGWRD